MLLTEKRTGKPSPGESLLARGRTQNISESLIYCIAFSYGCYRPGLFLRPACFLELANTSTGLQDRTSGVLIMRNFSKRADRVTHRKLPSGPVPEQGRHSYSCNLDSEPDIFVNCNCSCAEVVQNRAQMSVCPSGATLIF